MHNKGTRNNSIPGFTLALMSTSITQIKCGIVINSAKFSYQLALQQMLFIIKYTRKGGNIPKWGLQSVLMHILHNFRKIINRTIYSLDSISFTPKIVKEF